MTSEINSNSHNNLNGQINICNRDNDNNKYRMWKIPKSGGKPRWVIVGGDGITINNNPTNEEIKSAIKWTFKYNSTHTCYRCRISFDNGDPYHGYPYRERDKDGKWIGIWVCRNCWRKYSPNSDRNKEKLERDCRNNYLDPNSAPGIGYITAVLVKKFLEIEDCFDITGNFNYPGYDIDHKYWGKIDVKGSSLHNYYSDLYHTFRTNKNKKANVFFCIGYDKNRKHVLAVYIIPNDDHINKLYDIKIPYNRISKSLIFKESEEEIKKWDELFHNLKLDNCSVLRHKETK